MKIDATTTPTATTAAATSGALKGTKDEFLRLFMAQLQNQDPFDPKNGSDMVAQLAQFSSVEQATESNQHLVDLATAQASSTSAALSGLVGRDCNAAAGDFQLDRGGAVPPMQITATTAFHGASVVITDVDGKELRRLPIANGGTSAQVAWDGNTAAGVPVPPGSYHVAVDAGTTTGPIGAQWHARVDSVELGATGTRLRMGGVLLSPGDIQTIGRSATSATSL
jgi:flagellar basal-body rod modification protein FlgD